MVFKRKFFLDLSGAGEKKPVQVAPPQAAPAKASVAPAPVSAPAPATAQAAPVAEATPAASPSGGQGPVLTTAEAIAAELAAAQANRPAPSKATFAPECVVPGGGMPRRRRLAGANLGTFKEMAKGMMRS